MKRKHLLLLTLILSQPTSVWGMDKEEFSTTRHSMYSNGMKSNVSTSHGFSSFMPSIDDKFSFNPSSFLNQPVNEPSVRSSFTGLAISSSITDFQGGSSFNDPFNSHFDRYGFNSFTTIADPSNISSYPPTTISAFTPEMQEYNRNVWAHNRGFEQYMNYTPGQAADEIEGNPFRYFAVPPTVQAGLEERKNAYDSLENPFHPHNFR